jgi:DNA-binding winged helix-turn-helix (wHTH) protein/TolB-like protein/Tfp pilus assembly protein PilF
MPAVTHYSFGSFQLYPSEQLLLRDKQAIPLSPKAFDLLLTLVSNHGRLLTRETLMKTIWPDSFVEETNLTVNISLLRKTLGEMDDGRPWIATAPKRGYRFDGAVILHDQAASIAAPDRAERGVPETVVPELEPVATKPESVAATTPAPHPGLSRWVAASLVLILAFLVLFLIFRHPFRSQASPAEISEIRTLAVLPFQSLDKSAEDEYLGLGMTDALITRLSHLSQLVVRPIGAVRSFSPNQDPSGFGRRLDVQAVLDGTIQKIEGQTRVTVRLLRVEDGRTVWTDRFDEQNGNAFALEDTISQKLGQALELRLNGPEQHRLPTRNSAAYDLYTQARYYWNKRSVESTKKSIELFQQAIQADPNDAPAYAGLADAYILAGSYGNSFLAPGVAMPKAKAAIEKALVLDDSSAEAHTSLAYIRLVNDWDWAGAEREFKRALELDPECVNAHHWYSHELMALGRIAESHRESEIALGLDPTDVVINEHMAWHHLMSREYDRAIAQAAKAIQLDPNFVQAHRVLGLAYLYTNRHKEASEEFEKGVALSHGDPISRAYLARCYAGSHREPEARKILASLEQDSVERYISSAEIAPIYLALGDHDSAIRWMGKAFDERAGSLIYLNVDRAFDPLRNDPRFLADLKRANLVPKADETASR